MVMIPTSEKVMGVQTFIRRHPDDLAPVFKDLPLGIRRVVSKMSERPDGSITYFRGEGMPLSEALAIVDVMTEDEYKSVDGHICQRRAEVVPLPPKGLIGGLFD